MTPDEAAAAREEAAEQLAVIQAAIARLEALETEPVANHIAVYDDVHDVLQGTLAGLGA